MNLTARWAPAGLLGLLLIAGVARAAPQPLSALQQLGRRMFLDPSLSASGKLACATCHDPKYAYGPPPGRAMELGGPRMNLSGTRAVPSRRYLREVPPFKEEFKFLDGDTGPIGGMMWDGRAASLEERKNAITRCQRYGQFRPAEIAAPRARIIAAGLSGILGGAAGGIIRPWDDPAFRSHRGYRGCGRCRGCSA